METKGHLGAVLMVALLATASACSDGATEAEAYQVVSESGRYPSITEAGGVYYLLMQEPPPNSVSIHASASLDSLGGSAATMIWDGPQHGMYNIWSPELVSVGGKWYVYFEADDQNTDNHQLYCLENAGATPTEGEWTLHGPIITNSDWNFGIHPSSIVVGGRQYLLWSGWQHQRAETEIQCIFIAAMANPWTLASPRVLISSPEYEWERQWINPDGSRTAYPIFVNENPEPFLSPDGKNLVVAYSASGIWTPYNSLGLLYAAADADLLNPASWHKLTEPVFKAPQQGAATLSASNVTVLTHGDDGRSHIIYEAKVWHDGAERINVRRKPIAWDDASLPLLGSPQ